MALVLSRQNASSSRADSDPLRSVFQLGGVAETGERGEAACHQAVAVAGHETKVQVLAALTACQWPCSTHPGLLLCSYSRGWGSVLQRSSASCVRFTGLNWSSQLQASGSRGPCCIHTG